MRSIKVYNSKKGGSLYHYGHFISDCLIPEINHNLSEYDNIYRIKNLDQTLGNFGKIYEDVMGVKNIEVPTGNILSSIIKSFS